jgi:hypothetical protein
MTSVNSSDSSNRDDVIRRNREDYRQNEAELAKRQQKEIRRINEAHAEEVENLNASHQKQIEAIQKDSHEVLTERDQKNTNDIESLRLLHKKQLQSTLEDGQKKEGLYREALRSERLGKQTQTDAKIGQIEDNTRLASKTKDEIFQKNLGDSRESQLRAIAQQREKLESAHAKELEEMRTQRDEKVAALEREHSSFRKNTDQKIKSQELRHFQDGQKQSTELVRAVQKERLDRSKAEGGVKDDYNDAMAAQRERYDESLALQSEGMERARANMENTVTGRQENNVRRLELENRDLKDGNIRNLAGADHQKSRELNNVKDAMQKNIENYRVQRDEAIRIGNERRKKDIDQLTEKSNQDMIGTHRYYREKLDTQETNLRAEYRNMNSDFNARSEQLEKLSDVRVKSIHGDAEESKARVMEHEQVVHETQQKENKESLRNIRVTVDSEKRDAIERIKELSRKNDIAHAEKLAEVGTKYEREIATLQDQLVRERRVGDTQSRRMIDEMERSHKSEMDQQMAKYEDRLRTVQEQHQEELRRVNRMSDEKVQQLLNTRKA